MNAKDYKKLASAKRTELPTIDVPVPSGGVWKLREPPIQQFILSGKLPTSLAAKMAAAATSGDGEAFMEKLTPDDVMNNLAFGRDLLLYCAVEPEISLNPTNENQIAPEEIDPEDFTFLMNWVLTGGKSGESLGNFRPERQQSAVAGTDG